MGSVLPREATRPIPPPSPLFLTPISPVSERLAGVASALSRAGGKRLLFPSGISFYLFIYFFVLVWHFAPEDSFSQVYVISEGFVCVNRATVLKPKHDEFPETPSTDIFSG